MKRPFWWSIAGGPVIRQKDNLLYGVTAGCLMPKKELNMPPLQVFTKISHYYDWISNKTGLKLPTC